jgi:hypothetical protein
MSTRPPVAQQYRFDHLIWEEINQAAALKKVVVLPIGKVQMDRAEDNTAWYNDPAQSKFGAVE